MPKFFTLITRIMQTYSYIATVQVDFQYDGEAVTYDQARRTALSMVIRPLFHTLQDGTKVERIVVSDNEGAGVQFEMEED